MVNLGANAEDGTGEKRFYITPHEEIKDLSWILNQGPDQYRRFGKEEFTTDSSLSLNSFGWDGKLDIYRLQVLSAAKSAYEDWRGNFTVHLVNEMIMDRCKSIATHISSWSDYLSDREGKPYNLMDFRAEDEIYRHSSQLRDATDPKVVGQDNQMLSELHSHANFLVYMTADRGSYLGFHNRLWKLSDDGVENLAQTLIDNNPAHTPYRQERVKGAYRDLDKMLGRIEQKENSK